MKMQAEKILVVDDIETNRRLLNQMLVSFCDYQVFEAVNGKDAIEIYEKEKPDLILMDIDMPIMNGIESASSIKNLSNEEYTPIIFVTAMSAEASLAYALASGGDDFISKPFQPEILESKINAHLRIRELNQQLKEQNKQLTNMNQQLTHEQLLIEHFFESALKRSYLDTKYIKYHMSSMSTFNGDLLLAERGPDGGLYVIVGDFTGHGLTAAMGTLPVAMIFFTMVGKGVEIGSIASEINRQLYNLMPPSMFFAATLVEINPDGDHMSVWMGGMPKNYWFDNSGKFKGEIHSQHVPLGISPNESFDSAVEDYSIEKGDRVYLYSDGIIEAQNQNGDMLGEEKLKNILVSQSEDRLSHVVQELESFTGSSDQNDDITLIEIICNAVPPKDEF